MSASPTRTERLVWRRAGRDAASAPPATDEVHLWSFRVASESGRDCLPLLSADERARAACLLSLPARHQAVVARAKLRSLLGAYLGRDPARLRFTAGPHGKPRLADDEGAQLEFNLSHSRDVLLIGVATGRALGVDVEHIREVGDLEGLARVALTPAERDEVFAQAAGRARLLRFFQFWTRKEAYLKATGEGIVAGMASTRRARWCTHDIALGSGLAGAVVTAPAA